MSQEKSQKVFLSYLDENENKREGFVQLIEIKDTYVKIKTFGDNELIIPMHRVLKLKKKVDGDDRL